MIDINDRDSRISAAATRSKMIRIAITQAAYEAIAATLPLGSVGYEAQRTDKGERLIWLEERWVKKLSAR